MNFSKSQNFVIKREFIFIPLMLVLLAPFWGAPNTLMLGLRPHLDTDYNQSRDQWSPIYMPLLH